MLTTPSCVPILPESQVGVPFLTEGLLRVPEGQQLAYLTTCLCPPHLCHTRPRPPVPHTKDTFFSSWILMLKKAGEKFYKSSLPRNGSVRGRRHVCRDQMVRPSQRVSEIQVVFLPCAPSHTSSAHWGAEVQMEVRAGGWVSSDFAECTLRKWTLLSQ